MWRSIAATLLVLLGIPACDLGPKQVPQEAVKEFFAKNRVGSSTDYAIVKNGHDHLATIHGFMDDQAVCLQLIEEYNRKPSLSAFPGHYTCVPLNSGF